MLTIMALAATASLYLIFALGGQTWRSLCRGAMNDTVKSGVAGLIFLACLVTVVAIAWTDSGNRDLNSIYIAGKLPR